jgi:biopolymer transport protein ExbD
MARQRKKRQSKETGKADLTPMIDVTFQLLIFFILCTRFKVEERNHTVELPKDEGLSSAPSVPKEQVTIYCQWDPATKANTYVVALDARLRRPVEESYAAIGDLVIFPSDNMTAVREKKARYGRIFNNLVEQVESYIANTGANIEKLEISFALDATRGAASGTAPWMFVSLAIDAAAQVNKNRAARGVDPLPVTFKFADSLGRYTE